MSDNDINACWGSNVDTDHLGDVLIVMGEALKGNDSGMGLQGAEYTERASHDEFGEHELTLRYAKGGATILANPIRYTEDAAGNDPDYGGDAE